MSQSVWHKSDIGQIASTLLALAPSPEFAAGVLALANAMGAPVRLPELREPAPVVVMIDAPNGHEVTR